MKSLSPQCFSSLYPLPIVMQFVFETIFILMRRRIRVPHHRGDWGLLAVFCFCCLLFSLLYFLVCVCVSTVALFYFQQLLLPLFLFLLLLLYFRLFLCCLRVQSLRVYCCWLRKDAFWAAKSKSWSATKVSFFSFSLGDSNQANKRRRIRMNDDDIIRYIFAAVQHFFLLASCF